MIHAIFLEYEPKTEADRERARKTVRKEAENQWTFVYMPFHFINQPQLPYLSLVIVITNTNVTSAAHLGLVCYMAK